MISNFDINSLLKDVFGIGRGKPYDPSQVQIPGFTEAGEYEEPNINNEEGTEFVNMRDSLQANTPYGQRIFMPMKVGGLLLPNEPTVTIRGVKRIVSTPLTGSKRKGSVKELISIDDYQITIRGIALNFDSAKVYPEDLVKGIHDLYLKNESLKVESALTNLLGIYRLVVKDINLPPMIGVQHAQAYELQCMSDEGFILEIK